MEEIHRRRENCVGVQVVTAVLGAHSETVVAPQPGEVILNDRAAIGVVSCTLMAPTSQIAESWNVTVQSGRQ